MRVVWKFIGGFGRCLRFIGGSRWVSSSVALLVDSLWFLAVAIFEESRWLSLTDKICGSPRGWKSAVAADYNRKDERWFDFFSQKERRHRTAKLSDLSVSEGIKKEPKQVAGEIHFFFTRKNFNVKSKV